MSLSNQITDAFASVAAAINGRQKVPGAWSNMTLGTNVTSAATYSTISARLEGDRVAFRGRISMSGAYTANATMFTLPVGMRPSVNRAVATRASTGLISLLIAANTGVVTYTSGITTGATIDLDGIDMPLA